MLIRLSTHMTSNTDSTYAPLRDGKTVIDAALELTSSSSSKGDFEYLLVCRLVSIINTCHSLQGTLLGDSVQPIKDNKVVICQY